MRTHTRQSEPYRWDGVPVRPYKETGAPFRGVTRQVLFEDSGGLAAELRYFEVEPGGHSTLERHEHEHRVMVVSGRGRCLVGREIHELELHDLVYVPPRVWHQFRAGSDEPLGFLCLVPSERDRPERPDERELAELTADPPVAAFVRT